MFRARTFPILGLVVAVALAAFPADAAQRGGRRDGGSGQPPAAPPPDTGRRAVPRPGHDGPPPGGAGRDVVVMTPGVGAQGHRRGPYGYPGPVYGTYRNPVYGSFLGPTYGPYPGPIYASPYRYSRPYYTFRPRTTLGVGFYAGFAVPFPGVAYGGVSSLLRRRLRLSRALPGSISGALPLAVPVNRLPIVQLPIRPSSDG